MTPEDFIPTYEKALATQDWKNVGPLIANEASVTFSDGVVHKGKDNVQSAFEKNFATIKSEHYKISNLHWVKKITSMRFSLLNTTGVAISVIILS